MRSVFMPNSLVTKFALTLEFLVPPESACTTVGGRTLRPWQEADRPIKLGLKTRKPHVLGPPQYLLLNLLKLLYLRDAHMSSEKPLIGPDPNPLPQLLRPQRKPLAAIPGASVYTRPHDNAHAPVLPLSVLFTQNSEIVTGAAPAPARQRGRAGLQSRRKRSDQSGALAPEATGCCWKATCFASNVRSSRKRRRAICRFLTATPPRLEFLVTRRKQRPIEILIATRIRLSQAPHLTLRPSRFPFIFVVCAALAALISLGTCPVKASRLLRSQSSASPPASPVPQSEVPAVFAQGEAALRAGELDRAEADFRKVLAADPTVAGAYANLGVIAMRKQQWQHALDLLRKADHLAPTVAGIRLNIGLVYYRQNEFPQAIAPFESVVRDQPQSVQARYLLGLCYFFTERYGDAVQTLDPLWAQESDDLNYLYVLGNAANKAGKSDIEDRALTRFVELGQNTAEYHMLMGKAALNRDDNDKAIAELQKAVELDPKLPYLHFNLGLAYLAQTDFEHARDEFQRDVAIEPDVAFNYDRLGTTYAYLQDDAKAEENFKEALRRDTHLASSYFGLARVYQRQGKFADALVAVNSAAKIDPDNSSYRNLKGQILIRLGRAKEGQAELQQATQLLEASRQRRHNEMSQGPLPQPELSAEPKVQ
ncbi:MAG: tetratricopeptide repeat protein [Candidatus Acidiferrales bacterium]